MSIMALLSDTKLAMLAEGSTPDRIKLGINAMRAVADETYASRYPGSSGLSSDCWHEQLKRSAGAGELYVFGVRVEYSVRQV